MGWEVKNPLRCQSKHGLVGSTPLGYTQISNNSIGLESIEIIQFSLKICIPSRLLHPWVGEWFDGWVKAWSYVKSLKIK